MITVSIPLDVSLPEHVSKITTYYLAYGALSTNVETGPPHGITQVDQFWPEVSNIACHLWAGVLQTILKLRAKTEDTGSRRNGDDISFR